MVDFSTNRPPFWMSATDRKGRPIPPSLLEIAQLVWPRFLWITERELKDTAQAAEILDRAVCVVARIMHRRGPQAGILDPASYLYWVAARILYRTIEREKMIQFIDDLEPILHPPTVAYRNRLSGTEKKILINQVLRYMDSRTRRIFLLRVLGHSWEQIGALLGISANNAAVTYNAGLGKTRQRIYRSNPGRSKPAAGGAR